jgi:hypothetical protein
MPRETAKRDDGRETAKRDDGREGWGWVMVLTCQGS